jgi:hypothetical protein
MDLWHAATSDPYLTEKNTDEIPIFALFVERGLLTVKFRQPSHEFTFGVDMSFILYPLVLTPLV